MVVPCNLWQIALDCELSNWMTMILELTIAGIFAILLSAIFYRKQKSISEKLYEFENGPEIKIDSTLYISDRHNKGFLPLEKISQLIEKNCVKHDMVKVKVTNISSAKAIIIDKKIIMKINDQSKIDYEIVDIHMANERYELDSGKSTTFELGIPFGVSFRSYHNPTWVGIEIEIDYKGITDAYLSKKQQFDFYE